MLRDGHIYALPFDTWAPLWHLNLNLFRKAGMVHDGVPVLPHSPEELMQQARQFTRATGKPYLIQSMVNDPSVYGVSEAPEVFEDHPKVPLTYYNRYKWECEQVLAKLDPAFEWSARANAKAACSRSSISAM